MPELQQKTLQRQIAYKVKISDVLNGSFTKDEIFSGYIKINDANVSRVNIIATVVYKSEGQSYASAIIDDGTGRISLRSFENRNKFSNIDVGDVVLMIGKIRDFNNEKYVIPEILKKVSLEWLSVRKTELKHSNMIEDKAKIENKNLIEEVAININEEIYLLIKKLDNGDGVAIEDVVKNSNNNKVEQIIKKLLESGDIFEIKPGKIKLLE